MDKKIIKESFVKDIEKLIIDLFDKDIGKKIELEDFFRIVKQDNVSMFVNKEDGKVVSMLMMYVIELFSRKFAVIEEVVTLKEYRNQGKSSKLINNAIDKARKLGADCVELNVREDKPEVQKFYEHLGFYDRYNKSMRMWINKQ